MVVAGQYYDVYGTVRVYIPYSGLFLWGAISLFLKISTHKFFHPCDRRQRAIESPRKIKTQKLILSDITGFARKFAPPKYLLYRRVVSVAPHGQQGQRRYDNVT